MDSSKATPQSSNPGPGPKQICTRGRGAQRYRAGTRNPCELVLLDDSNARKLATMQGLQVRGSVGLLEAFYLRGYLVDLRAAYRQLQLHSYIDQRLLDARLNSLGLPAL